MKVLVTGGAGFIGSNLVARLLKEGHAVTVFDNLGGGRRQFLRPKSSRWRFIHGDVRDLKAIKGALAPTPELVFHLAANADIARGMADPTLDFDHSLVGTFSLLRAMHAQGVKKLVYTSGSGVYGDSGTRYLSEGTGPLTPVSMYGATKLGAEGLISAFAHLYGLQAWIVRPANIVGPGATHGVVFDFVARLSSDPTHLPILGDGAQSKSYLHVDDVLEALFLILGKALARVNIFNLSSRSFITVKQIADLVIKEMGLEAVRREYTGGKVGWPGDVAIVRLDSTKLARLGWRPRYTSRQAVTATVRALLAELSSGASR